MHNSVDKIYLNMYYIVMHIKITANVNVYIHSTFIMLKKLI